MGIVTGNAWEVLNSLKGEPASVWKLSKKIKIRESNIRKILQRLDKEGYIEKRKTQYHLTSDIVVLDGIAMVFNPKTQEFILFGCKYFKKECKCSGYISKSCKKLKELVKSKNMDRKSTLYKVISKNFM